MSTLGTLIRTHRLGLGLSLRDVASAFQVTHSTIAAWENGRLLVTAEVLDGLCDFLGVPLERARELRAQDQLERDKEAVRRHEERLAARRNRRAA